jgi:F-type H+-transporting ATPase subunit beta
LTKADRTLYERARRMQNFLTQPMFVAESYTGKKGQFVRVADTLDSVEKILDGRTDNRTEEEFYMIGAV